MPPKSPPCASARYAPSTGTFWCLLSAPCLMLLAACSPKPSLQQTPPLPASLSAPCQPLPDPPNPLIDPERTVWEAMLISIYGDCALRHRLTVSAAEG